MKIYENFDPPRTSRVVCRGATLGTCREVAGWILAKNGALTPGPTLLFTASDPLKQILDQWSQTFLETAHWESPERLLDEIGRLVAEGLSVEEDRR